MALSGSLRKDQVGVTGARSQRSFASKILVAGFALLAMAGFVALGVWQLERRVWKLDLIHRVNERIHAAPVAAPGPSQWPSVTPRKDEYLRVEARGHYLNSRETLVEAVTKLGGGFWVMTPFKTDRGFTILVNRGFTPTRLRDQKDREDGIIHDETEVTGLVRMTEPKGAFLRSNNPKMNLWYSRDVQAIAKARGLKDAAPYFIDADASGSGFPRGGLTVIAFPNNHFVYALTWFGLALTAGAFAVAGLRKSI